MNAAGHIIGTGRIRGFTAKIRPFKDRPDIEMDWLFYAVPWTNPLLGPTVFTDRFWDAREHWIPPGVGIVPSSLRAYLGPLPPPTVNAVVGTPQEWLEGLLYARWLAGGYSDPVGCWPVTQPDEVPRIRQAQDVLPFDLAGLQQAQDVAFTSENGVATACCPNLIPYALNLHVAGSELADGDYALSYNAGLHVWTYSGVFGACGGGGIKVFVGCDASGPNWSLSHKKTVGIGFWTVLPDSESCDPFEVVFSPSQIACAGDPPGTWTVTPL